MGRRSPSPVSSVDSLDSERQHSKKSKKKKHRDEKRKAGKRDKNEGEPQDQAVGLATDAGVPSVAAGAFIPPPPPPEPTDVVTPPPISLEKNAYLQQLMEQAEAARAALKASREQHPDTDESDAPAASGDVDDASSESDDDIAKVFDDGVHESGDDDDDDEAQAGFQKLLQFAKAVSSSANGAPVLPPPPPNDDGPQIVDDAFDGATSSYNASRAQVKAPRMLKEIDHSLIQYPAFRKNFFIAPPDVAKLSESEIRALQEELDGAKVTGKNVPPPIKTWIGIGLNEDAMEALAANHFEGPFAVQSVAIPILMSGRDLLAIAKTGSGKTLAYLLPLLRHVHAQPRCGLQEGPIGLILVPTHELADQIFKLAKALGSAMNLKVVPCYGGISLAENIGHCKAGADVVVATPGRLFDLLVSHRGNTMNLRRCTFVVIDEADRMFDEGFSGHVAAFLGQIRPDRQLAMVSSTMPTEVYRMAKRFLANDFLELSVGGRPSPSSNVKQTIEFFDPPPDNAESATFELRTMRLLQILGEMGPKKLVLVFVSSKGLCDKLWVTLTDRGYGGKVGAIYSGMDQMDREFALACFSPEDQNILLATGVAERGVDIHDLDLVVNYSMPDHYEAYVNRIGRTGRAGRKGRAITFLVRTTADELMAPDLVKGLELSNNDVPQELQALAEQIKQKRKNGIIRHQSNYSKGYKKSHGYTFATAEKRREQREAAKAMGIAEFLSDEDEDLDYNSDDAQAVRKKRDPAIVLSIEDSAGFAAGSATGGALTVFSRPEDNPVLERLNAARQTVSSLNAASDAENQSSALSMKQARYEINGFGERLRKKIISRRYLDEVSAETDTSITVKGVYMAKPQRNSEKEPLYLEIRGKESVNITRVFRKFDELIAEMEAKANRAAMGLGAGKGRAAFDGKKQSFFKA